MANENKNINELVSDDDDPTAELDAATVRHAFQALDGEPLESDANTFDFDEVGQHVGDDVSVAELRSDLKARSETIERLQFDIQQLHAKWVGLETEIKAREELTRDLGNDLKTTERKLARKEKLLAQRDRTIKSLKSEIREREQQFRELETQASEYRIAMDELRAGDEITAARRKIEELRGEITAQNANLKEYSEQQARTERYADELRRQLADLADDTKGVFTERVELEQAVSDAIEQNEELLAQLRESRSAQAAAEAALEAAGREHEAEIRTLRFELGQAEDTLAEGDKLSETLASELVDTRNSKALLEDMLVNNEQQNQARIEELEALVKSLEASVTDLEEKLEAKAEAVQSLLSELARRTQEIDSIGEMEDVIHDIDDRISERFDERPAASGDRVTRLLVGRIDKQELRFPLFKDRLTIGRAQDNDIQLKAQYISRRHAVVMTEGDATRVIDWGSKNGVYVNSRRVTEHFLQNGDILSIGTAKFRYEERPKRDH